MHVCSNEADRFTGVKKARCLYTPYEGLISTNQNDRKLDVYDWKLEGSHSIAGRYFYKYLAKKEERIPLEMFLRNGEV